MTWGEQKVPGFDPSPYDSRFPQVGLQKHSCKWSHDRSSVAINNLNSTRKFSLSLLSVDPDNWFDVDVAGTRFVSFFLQIPTYASLMFGWWFGTWFLFYFSIYWEFHHPS